jgi:hypothetical protein
MSTFPASDLSLENVLRDVHDPVTQTLRTTTTSTVILPTDIDVTIEYQNDSIALADPNTDNFLKINADGSIDVNVGAVTNPSINNFNIPMANTEYNFAFPAGTKRFLIRCRNSSILKFSYISGQSGTVYVTVPAGSSYSEENLSVAPTIYFQSSKPTEVLEILSWA